MLRLMSMRKVVKQAPPCCARIERSKIFLLHEPHDVFHKSISLRSVHIVLPDGRLVLGDRRGPDRNASPPAHHVVPPIVPPIAVRSDRSDVAQEVIGFI